MAWDSGKRGLAWYRAIYVSCIVILSVLTMRHARDIFDHHFWLAGLEILGAVLLLLRGTQVVGLWILLAVYAVAATHGVLTGEVPAGLVVFGASAALIVYMDRGLKSEAGRGDATNTPPATGRGVAGSNRS
jgi:hypothetical protein